MNLLKTVLFALSFCLAQNTFALPILSAGTEGGNGGDIVKCGSQAELLDIYEARSLRYLNLSLGDKNLPIAEKIKIGISRIKKMDPYRAQVIENLVATFDSDVRFVRGIELRDVNDSNEVFLPTGCELKQIAVQNKSVVRSDLYYVINADLWDLLDNDNKASLMLHEIIFKASDSAWGSSRVRLLNSLLFTDDIDNWSRIDYYKFLEGTPMMDTLNISATPSGQWYFQLPANTWKPGFFWEPETFTVVPEESPWSICMNFHNSSPVSGADILDIWKIMKDQFNFNNVGELPKRYIYLEENGELVLYSIDWASQLLKVPAPGPAGEIWCKKDSDPLK